MFARLLVCTDGSAYGEAACDYGLFFARALNARLTALHVLDIRLIEGPLMADVSGMIGAAEYFASMPQFKALMEEKGNTICRTFAGRADAAGVAADCCVDTGHPFHVIMHRAQDCDLLIVGRRGENEPHGRDLIGSVAERVMRRAPKPCLVTPLPFKPVTHVLAATDGSPLATKAAETAAALAAALGVRLTVVSVAEVTDRIIAQHTADEAAQRARTHLAAVETRVCGGEAAEGILETAAATGADLVVMGAHSHTRVREWFVGCTTLRILADSALPALLVR